MSEELGAVADAEQRETAPIRCLDERRLRGNLPFEVRPVDGPLAAERDHELVPVELRPFVRAFPVALREGKAPSPELLADVAGVGVVPVGDQQCAHTSTVRARMTLPQVEPERIARALLAGRGVVKHTPVTSSVTLSERCGGTVVLKAENLQRTGSFKLRGALAKLDDLGPHAANGVVAGSAGNHAQALAFAARHHGVPCEIFVPAGASLAKMEACRSYGATVVMGGDSLTEAVTAARERATERNLAFCHPYDDLAVVAGQATLGLELLDDIAELRRVVVPLGGGGLSAGLAMALKRHDPSITVIGVQVAGCAPYANQPPPPGAITTLADGIAVKLPGELTRPLVEHWLDDVVVVEESAVADAMVFLMERAKLYVEGAGAVGVAALASGRVVPARTGTTCAILSGGNVDLGVLPSLIRRHETRSGRRLILFARIDDRPGALARLLTLVAEQGANLIEVEHVREGVDLHVRETGVQIVLEVRGVEHAAAVLQAASAAGYHVTRTA
jgi:threonine dehydratase